MLKFRAIARTLLEEEYIFKFNIVNEMAFMWRGGVAHWIRNLDSPGFESHGRHSSCCVIPVTMEFTHSCSKSTQPSHPSVDRPK